MKIKYLNSEVIIGEMEPATRTVSCYGHRFRISFPRLIFIVRYAKLNRCEWCPVQVSVFMIRHPLESIKDQFGSFYFPNVGTTGLICDPNHYGLRTSSPEELFKKSVHIFWSSHFTYNLGVTEARWGCSTDLLRHLERNPNWWKNYNFIETYSLTSTVWHMSEDDRCELNI